LDAGVDAACEPEPAAKKLPPLCAGADMTRETTLHLSADDSNSMAAPAIVRSLVQRGARFISSPGLFRTHEFLNYYRFDHEPPRPGQFGLLVQGGSCAASGDLAVQITVRSPPFTGVLPPLRLTLVLDTSGSMAGPPIFRQRAAIRAIASVLREGDLVNAVTWATKQNTILAAYKVAGPDDPALLSLADKLGTEGETDLNAGLARGYELARKSYEPGSVNRVVLISDGIANVGVTSEHTIGAMADDREAEGIYLVGVGVGDGVNDTLMNAVTDAGRGAYVYLDSEEEAWRMLSGRFAEVMLVAARDVRIALTMPPYLTVQKFSGEVFSTSPARVRPQHLAPDDTMILYQLLRPCDASMVNGNDAVQVDVGWRDPLDGSTRGLTYRSSLNELPGEDRLMRKAALIVGYVDLLRGLLPTLPRSSRVQAILRHIELIDGEDPPGADQDLREIKGILQQLQSNQ
jgi:Ca-activated chloride channel family protein